MSLIYDSPVREFISLRLSEADEVPLLGPSRPTRPTFVPTVIGTNNKHQEARSAKGPPVMLTIVLRWYQFPKMRGYRVPCSGSEAPDRESETCLQGVELAMDGTKANAEQELFGMYWSLLAWQN